MVPRGGIEPPTLRFSVGASYMKDLVRLWHLGGIYAQIDQRSRPFLALTCKVIRRTPNVNFWLGRIPGVTPDGSMAEEIRETQRRSDRRPKAAVAWETSRRPRRGRAGPGRQGRAVGGADLHGLSPA